MNGKPSAVTGVGENVVSFRRLRKPRELEAGALVAVPAVLTIVEAAEYVRLHLKKFRKVVKRGEIYYKQEGRSKLFPRWALDEWVGSPSASREKNSSW